MKLFLMNQIRFLGLFLLIFFGPVHILAQHLLTESFNYPPNTLFSSTNWTQRTANGSGIASIGQGNLSYPNSIGNSIGNKVSLGQSGFNYTLDFTNTSTATNPIYASFIVNVSQATAIGDYFYALSSSATGIANGAKLYVKANGTGYSFGLVRSAGTIPVYETTVRPFHTPTQVVLKYETVAGVNNDAIKLFVNPSLGLEPAMPSLVYSEALGLDAPSITALVLIQGNNGPHLEIDGLNLGTTWKSVTDPIYDYGDSPNTFNYSKDGVFNPPGSLLLSGLGLGRVVPDLEYEPHSVAPGANNNGDQGDGLDEDALSELAALRKGVPFTIQVPVTNPTVVAKYLYGWIDFNGDGQFQADELADVVVAVTAKGTTLQQLTWSGVKTAKLGSEVKKTYMRLRLANRSLIDFTTVNTGGALIDERSIGNGATSAINATDHKTAVYGEVEDYQLEVVKTFEYGDLPVSYDTDKDGQFNPAKHVLLKGFSLGELIDIEEKPASVNSPNENNQSGDNQLDLADEDGIADFISVSRGAPYSLVVSVNIPAELSGTKYVYGWLDLNGDGKFQSSEFATTTTTLTGQSQLTLTWTNTQTASIAPGTEKIYLRLRLSNLVLNDFTNTASGGALIDERSIGNGASSSTSAIDEPLAAFGEVEDYQLNVDLYDFGDVPLTYEQNHLGTSVPARQSATSDYLIGQIVKSERVAKSVAPGADNNADNGDGLEEDGLKEIPTITKGAPFSFDIPTRTIGTSSAIAWIDFNNNGRFEANEVAYKASTGTAMGYQSVVNGQSSTTFYFRGSQTAQIPEGIQNVYVRIRLARTVGIDNEATTMVDERSIGDGASSGIYSVPIEGEVEDYFFKVNGQLHDFGDAPESYEMDKDGTAAINFKPARNSPSPQLFIGKTYTLENKPFSVQPNADNNGSNGDGISDDGLESDQLFLTAGRVNTLSVAVNNSTGLTSTLHAWIDLNNNGRFEANEYTYVNVADGIKKVNLTFNAAQMNRIPDDVDKLYMRLRLIQPDTGVVISDLTTGSLALVVDERSIADGLSTGEYGTLSMGEVEDYQLTMIRDFGDLPLSYENGNPASQVNTFIPELYMGKTVEYELTNAFVAPGADNNGQNGDGLEEDAIETPQIVTAGSPYSVTLPINSTTLGTKRLYAWIDFNGDGFFSQNEAAVASIPSITIGVTNQVKVTWPTTNLSTEVIAAGKTYARFRLSDVALTNANSTNAQLIDTRSYGRSNGVGEIEDYQFLVGNHYDYGDAPEVYNRNKEGQIVAPRQAVSSFLRLGKTIDHEPSPNTVAPNANNNGANGDGLEEDGVFQVMPIYKGTSYYAKVSVYNNTGEARSLHGWVDFNNNGYFEVGEYASVNVPNSVDQQTVYLAWDAAKTNAIGATTDQVYMRLRIADGTLTDYTAGGAVGLMLDERSIADGLATGVYGTALAGEVEDYVLPVVAMYDYGDAPNEYDMTKDNVLVPARQAISDALYIGNAPADYEMSKQIETGTALGDDNHGENDEGGLDISSIYKTGGNGYAVNVKVTNQTTAAKTLFGWIDFNNNGRFEVLEMASIPVPLGTSDGWVTLTWTNTRTNIVGNPSHLFLRLRLSEGALSDQNTGVGAALLDERSIADGIASGVYASVFNGEVEDHQIPVTENLDYGDVPISFEQNAKGESIPARHLPSFALLLGKRIETETSPFSVAAGADNNGEHGDGLEEDGIQTPMPTLLPGNSYSVEVDVTNHLNTKAYVHAWIDMDGNGRFTSEEYTSTVLEPNTGAQKAKLYWYTTSYSGSDTKAYMRVRVTSSAFEDNPTTLDVDERSIGDGQRTGIYAAYPANGEVEDYNIPIDQSIAIPQGCDDDGNQLGRLSPIKALFHASIVKTATGGFLVFGYGANGYGTIQNTPVKVESGSNGFKFAGQPLFVTGLTHQYYLLTTSGLYAWGLKKLFSTPSEAIHQVSMPPGVSPANVQLIDAGLSSDVSVLAILTKSGEVWVQSSAPESDVQGNGNLPKSETGWHQVLTAPGVPLTGMKDVRVGGPSIFSTDGTSFYTWGTNVYLGAGSRAETLVYATKMQTPTGISLPAMQTQISYENTLSTSYYIRDNAGKVFVLGENQRGQLGLGNANNSITAWKTIDYMNEQPNAPGRQPDVTKPIKKVIWISASNSDGGFPHLSLITEDFHNYTAASNGTGGSAHGSMGGARFATNINIPTAATQNVGEKLLEGKMLYTAAGGHITILVKDKNDRYGYVGHTADGSDGCGGCTGDPFEFNFKGPPSTGPVCGNEAFDYGDLDDRYNLGDQASHQIRYSQAENPLKLGENAADSDDGPQFTISGSANNADGDDLDGKGSLIDEDAFESGKLPLKTAATPYTLEIPVTNLTGKTAYVYAFIDWNVDGRFEPNETRVGTVKAIAGEQKIVLTWDDPGAVPGCNEETIRSFIRLRITTDVLLDDESTAVDERSFVKADDGEVEDYYVDWICGKAYCYKPGLTTGGPILDGFSGITALNRSEIHSNAPWPKSAKGSWLVLESKNKGFVLNRVAFDATGNPVGIPATSFVEGMAVYDTKDQCLKIYTTTDGGTTYQWSCFDNQSCPDIN